MGPKPKCCEQDRYLQKKALRIMSFQSKGSHSSPLTQHQINNLSLKTYGPTKIKSLLLENILKTINEAFLSFLSLI